MKFSVLSHATALIIALAAGILHAQVVPPTPTTPPSPQVMTQQADTQRVTATGCLKQERDIPGLLPNMADRVGMGEGFVLTNARLTGVAASDTSPTTKYSRDMARGPSSALYAIAGLDKDKLQSLLNQQVEVTGRLETAPHSTDAAPPTAQPDKHAETEGDTQAGRGEHLQQIRATAIRSTSGTCTGGTW
jgi:hypothetical protein